MPIWPGGLRFVGQIGGRRKHIGFHGEMLILLSSWFSKFWWGEGKADIV
jgi:hypothetical protein